MSSILNRLFSPSLLERPTGTTNAWQTIGWWETRRVPFNLIIGIVGVLTVATGTLAMSVTNAFLETPLHRPDPPLFLFTLAYAVVVNLFYTGGWMVELLWCRLWPATKGDVAILTFRLGLVLSILVTTLPAVLATAFAVHAILTRRPLISP
jgi:hypothetical protein